MKWFRRCSHLSQYRNLCSFLVAVAVLFWLLWTYRRPFMHAVRYLGNADYRKCVHRQRQYEIEMETSPLYVTVEEHGRIGNWMFAYASLLGIAKANGYIPYILASHQLTSIFSLSKIQPGNAECLQTVYDDRPCSYNSEFMNLPSGNISIAGYIQSWKYFRLMEKEIRKEFTLNNFVRTRAALDFTSYVGEYVRAGRPVVGVHVRRGDVTKPEARKLGYSHAPKSYLDNAMKYMLQKYPNAIFLVTSDDIEWCKENVIPPKLTDIFDSKKALHKFTKRSKIKTLQDKVPVVFSKGQDPWSDFSVLSLCNHSIITVGTFGWWSAWLANGHVVYYKDVPLPGTKLDYELTKEDYFPVHWVGLSGNSAAVSVCLQILPGQTVAFSLVLIFIILKTEQW